MSVKSRAEVMMKNKLCFNCLKPECQSFKCTSQACLKCNYKHNTQLYIDNYKSKNTKIEDGDSSTQEQEKLNSIQTKATNNSNSAIIESSVNCSSIIEQL